MASANPSGRFPANLILSADEDGQVSEEVRECFPETKSGKVKKVIRDILIVNLYKAMKVNYRVLATRATPLVSSNQ